MDIQEIRDTMNLGLQCPEEGSLERIRAANLGGIDSGKVIEK